MKKILSIVACAAVFGMAGTASASPITFTDTTFFTATGTNATEDLVSYGGGAVNVIGDTLVDWVKWEHQFSFVPEAQTILGASIVISFADDTDFETEYYFNNIFDWGWETVVDTDDSVKEYAVGWAEDWTWDVGEVDTGAEMFNIGIDYVADGSFFVKIGGSSLTGDFNIVSSELTVTYEPVPEPATMLLMGLGLVGLVGYNRKRSNKKA